MDTDTLSTNAKDSEICQIAPEFMDMLVHPFESVVLIDEAVVTKGVCSRTAADFFAEILGRQEAQHAESIVD